MDIFDWMDKQLKPEERTTETLIYDHMPSQSGRSLPLIYQPFDPNKRDHWTDRGAALDFLLATESEGQRVLDFGPGDGWPSLILAPWVGEVVGVEGSQLRRAVCQQNAERLEITNATFRYVPPGDPLPFDDESFDAAVAASSLEQTPHPQATIAEIYRVLRPGGRLRIRYEALNVYAGGQEREVSVLSGNEATTRIILYDRHIEEEKAVQIALTFDMPPSALREALNQTEGPLTIDAFTVEALSELKDAIVDAGSATTRHPSGTTWQTWMTEIGFRQVFPTHSGIRMAGQLFDRLPADARPTTMSAIDSYLRPIVDVVVTMPAPIEQDPAITAIK